MITVAVYGRIGSGKSEVARVFAENGAVVISGDQLGKEVVDQDRSVLNELVDVFGRNIIDSQGRLKRRELGSIAFSSRLNRSKLDSIVHPPLLKRLHAKMNELKQAGKHPILVVDAALILHWGIESEFDVLICVTAPEGMQVERMIRSGLSRKEALDRLSSQIPEERQIVAADYVIRNSGTLKELRGEALRVLGRIKRREKTD